MTSSTLCLKPKTGFVGAAVAASTVTGSTLFALTGSPLTGSALLTVACTGSAALIGSAALTGGFEVKLKRKLLKHLVSDWFALHSRCRLDVLGSVD